MTPSQEAKEYAAANGFTITPNGRRYDIIDALTLNIVADVGGYPAALNAMKARKSVSAEVGAIGFGTEQTPINANHVSLDDVADFANAVVVGGRGKLYGFEQRPGETSEQFDARVDNATAELVAPVFVLESHNPKYVLDPLFENFNDESKARIRKAAAKMRSDAASCAVPYPWRLYGDSYELDRFGTRAQAVKASRQFYNEQLRIGVGAAVRSIRYVGV